MLLKGWQTIFSVLRQLSNFGEERTLCCRVTRKSKGIALVQFMEASDAKAAYAALDGSIFQGRLIHILAAKPVPQSHVQSSVGSWPLVVVPWRRLSSWSAR